MTAQEFAARVHAKPAGHGQWMAVCPAHNDRNPSLSIGTGMDGKVLLECHAGCPRQEVLDVLHLTDHDLFPETPTPEPQRFIYRDAHNQALFVVCRLDTGTKKKIIWQTMPDGTKGLSATLKQKASRPLYHLPDVLAQPDASVLVVEGEPHCDRLQRENIVAVTTSQGAGKSHFTDLKPLVGRDIILCPDNDEAGMKHMAEIADHLLLLKHSPHRLRILTLPVPTKGDILDWLAAGHEIEELRNLMREAPLYSPISSEDKTQAASKNASTNSNPLAVVSLADVQPTTVSWLWEPYIPAGKLTLVDGNPGSGKSWLTLALAAALSTGAPWPGTDTRRPAANVLLFTAEDGLSDTVVPRLTLAGADLSRIHAVQLAHDTDGPRAVDLTRDGLYIRDLVGQLKPALVVIDPIQAHTGGATDLNSANAVRSILTPLAALAETSGTAIVVVRHLRKSGSDNALFRGLGSVDFVAAARSVLLIARDPNDPARRGLVQIKNSLGPEGESLAYAIATQGLQWIGADPSLTAERLLGSNVSSDERSARDEAIEFLREQLTDGPQLATMLLRDSKSLGISERTLKRAKVDLNIRSWRSSEGVWLWQFPEAHEANDATDQPVGILNGNVGVASDSKGATTQKSGILNEADGTLNTGSRMPKNLSVPHDDEVGTLKKNNNISTFQGDPPVKDAKDANKMYADTLRPSAKEVINNGRF